MPPPLDHQVFRILHKIEFRESFVIDRNFSGNNEKATCTQELNARVTHVLRYGLVVRISGSHPGGPGSIPGNGIFSMRLLKINSILILREFCSESDRSFNNSNVQHVEKFLPRIRETM